VTPEITSVTNAFSINPVVMFGVMNSKVPFLDVGIKGNLKLQVLSVCWWQTMFCHPPGKYRVPVSKNCARRSRCGNLSLKK
jgi:hypothetical protein